MRFEGSREVEHVADVAADAVSPGDEHRVDRSGFSEMDDTAHAITVGDPTVRVGTIDAGDPKLAEYAQVIEEHPELREQTGLSQDKFALEHGQHRTWIGHLERAERAPTLYSIVELAHAFGITPSELLAGIRL